MKYNIEKIELKNEARTIYMYIEGWFYAENQKEIEVYSNENKIITEVEYIYREDVNTYLGIKDNSLNGFKIKVKPSRDCLKVVFKDSGIQEEYSINDIKARIKEYKKEKGIGKYISKYYYNRLKVYIKTLGIKATLRIIVNKVRKTASQQDIPKNTPYKYEYTFREVAIPQEWIQIQQYQASFAVLIKVEEWKEEFKLGLASLQKQLYKNFKVYFVVENKNTEDILVSKLKSSSAHYQWEIVKTEDCLANLKEEYLVRYSLYDELCTTTFAHMLETINIHIKPEIIYSDYDYFEEDGKYHTCIKKADIPKEKLNINVITRGICAVKNNNQVNKGIDSYIQEKVNEIKNEDTDCKNTVCHINKVLVHRRMTKAEVDTNVKAVAFYLPQFHAIPENDRCWGEGFTEWTNVRRAIPMFEGHNQPRIPGKLGYYNLVEDKDIQQKQAELAKAYNVYGFCYYYYWFNGKKLLEKPVENILRNKEITQPFCICWANENWTKRWDGMQHEIIMEQVHEQDSDERFIEDVIDIIKDERYIRIDNKPLILIYKTQLLHDGKQTIKKWREEVKRYGLEGLYVAIVKHPGITSPEQYGADAMVEFPPHDMNVNNITDTVNGLNKDFDGGIYDYSELANRDLTIYEYTIFRACMLQWDNTARRMQSASIFENFSPEDYKRWLLRCKEYEELLNPSNEQFVFINAWNEWAEGTYLEPDEKYGDKFLRITKQVLESR